MLKKNFRLSSLSLILAITTAFCCTTAIAKTKSIVKADANQKMIKQQMTKFMQQYDIPGAAVAVIDKGKTNIYVFGTADKSTNKPVTTQTIFELGSITKLFTTLLLAEEVTNSHMQMSDTLTQYLPALAKNKNLTQVTMQELATYSASLPFTAPDSVTSFQQMQDYLLHWQPTSPIGSVWQYSNMSIGLLGNALETKNQVDISQLYDENIFDPLKMTSAAIDLTDQQQANLAQGYSKNGSPAAHFSASLFPAAALSKGSIQDLANFLAAAVGVPNTPQNIHDAMQLAQTPRATVGDMEQALSWQLTSLTDKNLLHAPENMNLDQTPLQWLPADQQQFNPNMLIDKTGATDGFRAYIAVIPGQQSGIVILTNRYVSNGAIVDAGREILMSLPSLKAKS